MSLFGRRPRRLQPMNPYWRDIQRCQHRITELQQDACRSGDTFKSPLVYKDQRFLDDLAKRGQNYLMSNEQIRYFQVVAQKLYGSV